MAEMRLTDAELAEGARTVTDAKPHGPERIWLSPACDNSPGGDGRTWCADALEDCEECGENSVEYVRADLMQELAARIEKAAGILGLATQEISWEQETLATGRAIRALKGEG